MVEVYRAITLLLTVVAIVTWVIWLIRHPKKWGYVLWIIIWLVNIMVFYAAIMMADASGTIDPVVYNTWSIIIRWQALISSIGAAVLWWNNGHKKSDHG